MKSSDDKALKLFLFVLMLFQTLTRCSDSAISVLFALLKKLFEIFGKLFAC